MSPYLRHATRHIHHTVADHIEEQLTILGWMGGAGPVPFNSAPVVVRRTSGPAKDVEAQQVRISIGDEQHPTSLELGGPLTEQELPIFVDIFMDSDGTAVALACDVRDILLGRVGGKRSLPVIDQVNDTPVPGWRIELDDVVRVTPEHVLAMHWQIVKVTAVTRFAEVAY